MVSVFAEMSLPPAGGLDEMAAIGRSEGDTNVRHFLFFFRY